MPDLSAARDLCTFIDASPSPYHVVATVADRLRAAGFAAASEAGPLPGPGAHYLARGGSLVAWRAPERVERFRLVGAHTDSPNLRIKPRPDLTRAGCRQLGVEVYGGVLLNSWLDRDLGLSGRVTTTSGEVRLLHLDRALLRIPQLAIHLDREVNEKGLVLNRQQHLAPLWALDGGDGVTFVEVVAKELGVAADEIIAWDVMVHPVDPSRLLGLDEDLVSAPRIDNQLSCWAATRRHRGAGQRPDRLPAGVAQVVVLFDHEEVGSTSERGRGRRLPRLGAGAGRRRLRSGPGRVPGRPGPLDLHVRRLRPRHEPELRRPPRAGPHDCVERRRGRKANANLRYATEAPTAAVVVKACRDADVPLQWFVNRTDLACGSTIGPLTAAALGIATVDVGAPQLAMHSARELCGSADPGYLAAMLAAYLEPRPEAARRRCFSRSGPPGAPGRRPASRSSCRSRSARSSGAAAARSPAAVAAGS